MLIDCHVHLNNYHESTAAPTPQNVARLFEKMDERGVDHAVVITSYKVDMDRPSVEQVLEAVSGSPRSTVVEGLRWRQGKAEAKTDLYAMEARVREGLVHGIKLYPGYDRYSIVDPSLEAVFDLAARHDVPVMIHTGDTYAKGAKLRQAHPLLVDDVAVDYPDVKFVICHLGNPWLRDTAQVLYKNDNVYADMSGLVLGAFSHDFEEYMLQQVKEMIHFMGDPGRQLMYGSDWPLVSMSEYLSFFEHLPFTPEQRDAIGWQNAARLFHIDVNAAEKAREAAEAVASEDTAGS